MYKIIPVDAFDLVLFGGTGDLATREIFPGLFRRFKVGQLPSRSKIIGIARKAMTTEEYRNHICNIIECHVSPSLRDKDTLNCFLKLVHYYQLDVSENHGWKNLSNHNPDGRSTVFYLSVRPGIYSNIINKLKQHGLVQKQTRIVVEKPFGHDLQSAQKLNTELATAFDETQIYRIDHYLGKETVQNLMALRFSNVFFEPLWNSRFIDSIQITVAESAGVGGRGEYYDNAGAMRDMVQNHLLQLLCLVAMEPPAKFESDSVRDEKLKVINALDPINPEHIVLGQYTSGNQIQGYKEDVKNLQSNTESFIAMKCKVSNWRWAGTPFYIRTGKRLQNRVSEIAVKFKFPPHWIFEKEDGLRGNLLSIRLQPNEGIDLRVTIKEPGPGGMRLVEVPLDMSFAQSLHGDIGELINAYERLIMDVIRGNQTLFMRRDEIEAAWKWTDNVINCWTKNQCALHMYGPGSQGPEASDDLLDKDGNTWRNLNTILGNSK